MATDIRKRYGKTIHSVCGAEVTPEMWAPDLNYIQCPGCGERFSPVELAVEIVVEEVKKANA